MTSAAGRARCGVNSCARARAEWQENQKIARPDALRERGKERVLDSRACASHFPNGGRCGLQLLSGAGLLQCTGELEITSGRRETARRIGGEGEREREPRAKEAQARKERRASSNSGARRENAERSRSERSGYKANDFEQRGRKR